MKRGCLADWHSTMGVNLGIEDIEILWQGYGGMGLESLTRKLDTLQGLSVDPAMLIIHCGGNNLGKTDLKKECCEIQG